MKAYRTLNAVRVRVRVGVRVRVYGLVLCFRVQGLVLGFSVRVEGVSDLERSQPLPFVSARLRGNSLDLLDASQVELQPVA